jgi:translation initiation factor IF-1
MKRNILNWVGPALLSASMLAFTSCSTPDGTQTVAAVETPDGAIIVDTFTVTATVTGIDAAKRDVTLVTPNGHKTTYKAGPEVVNFAQIQIGDQVKATLTEEVAVYIGKDAPPSDMAATGVALAPVGAKPGGVMVDTTRVTAKVTAVNAKTHKVTFQLPDGTSKTVKVASKVDLSKVQPGDDVTVQMGEGLAITVTKA